MRTIDADKLEPDAEYDDGEFWAYSITQIENAPTITPERKRGRWEMLQIPISPPVYKCSVCGSHALQTLTGCLVNRHYESNLTNFCPSCGADMREGEA